MSECAAWRYTLLHEPLDSARGILINGIKLSCSSPGMAGVVVPSLAWH